MIRIFHVFVLVFVAVAGLMSLSAAAQTPDEVLTAIKTEAKSFQSGFSGILGRARREFLQANARQ